MIPSIKQEPVEPIRDPPPDIKTEPTEHKPDIHPTKRQKTETLKGKAKIVKEEVDSCGICLLEEGVSLRGYIDSCDHYFCFVCILEWAKVESKCPICKRRFSNIRRPVKDGVFVIERVVNVPVRDQVYYFNGNATVGPPDLYSQVKCSVCSLTSDDELLLLCDLCDSAAHSYCAGLGHTVPEGDWFCKDCTLSRDEHAKVETETPTNNNDNDTDNPSSSNTIRFAPSDVSIHDIVRENITRETHTSSVPAPVDQSDPIAEPSNTQSTFFRSSNARTLQRCLNVQSRIKILRENWDSFREGSVKFSSSSRNGNKESQSQGQSTFEKPYNTDKAWKMMDMAAKTLGRKCGVKSSVGKGLNSSLKKERLLNDASKVKPNKNYVGPSKNKMLERNKLVQGTVKNYQNHIEHEPPSSRKIIATAGTKNNRYYSQNLSRKECLVATSNVVGSSDGSSHLMRPSSIAPDNCCAINEIEGTGKNKQSLVGHELPSSRKIIATADTKNSRYYSQNLSRKECLVATSNVVGSSDESSRLIRPSSIAPDNCCTKTVIDATVEKGGPQLDNNIREVESAKSEIQSLVKLNLKLLCKDKKLDAEVFKEVARHATHSIMATCGIEPPKARYRLFESLVCNHIKTQKRPSSTLMQTSCRECFFVFVKDVVNTIAFERTASCQG